jgi:hypothetical protein
VRKCCFIDSICCFIFCLVYTLCKWCDFYDSTCDDFRGSSECELSVDVDRTESKLKGAAFYFMNFGAFLTKFDFFTASDSPNLPAVKDGDLGVIFSVFF